MLTLAASSTHEETVKRSRFVATGLRLDDPLGAPSLLAGVADPAATHVCWAWRVGQAYRSHDAGEPAGTAGRPILAAIDARGLDHVLVAVVRYFGGIKLGAGGLARTYGGAAARCLARATLVEVRPRVRLHAHVAPTDAGRVLACLERHGAIRTAEHWTGADGPAYGLDLEVEVDAEAAPALCDVLADLTHGRVRLEG